MGVWHVLVVALMISLLLRNILSNKLLLPKKTLCHLSRLWQEKKESIWKRICKRIYMYLYITELLCYTLETSTTL